VGVKGITPGSGTGVLGQAGASGTGLNGSGGYAGAYVSGGSYGGIFYGNSTGSYGIYANGKERGVTALGGTYGVYASGTTYGVYGNGPYGLYGKGQYGLYATGTTGGVFATTTNTGGSAIAGVNGQYGVTGRNGGTAGVRGDSGYVGVWGAGGSWGLYGQSTATSGTSIGVQGTSASSSGYGVYSSGNAHVSGTLSKTAGSFRIDHPLDPERKWLQHSFVESPDMMNVYNGNVTTDAAGLAIVDLPAYFGALNMDYRYQLTVIGTFAQAIIDREIVNNRFRIRTSKGRIKVSWMVTGIRQDAYAKQHRIKVELLKQKNIQGTREFVPTGAVARLMKVGPTD
jgi:hypothetical protein